MVLTFRHRRASGYEFTTDDRAEGAARAGPGAGPRLPAEAVGAVEVAVVVEAADVANHDQAYVVHDGAAAEVAAGAGAGAGGAGRSASSTIVSAMLPSGLDAASAVNRRKGAAGWPGNQCAVGKTSAGEKQKMPLTRAASASSRSLPLLIMRPAPVDQAPEVRGMR